MYNPSWSLAYCNLEVNEIYDTDQTTYSATMPLVGSGSQPYTNWNNFQNPIQTKMNINFKMRSKFTNNNYFFSSNVNYVVTCNSNYAITLTGSEITA